MLHYTTDGSGGRSFLVIGVPQGTDDMGLVSVHELTTKNVTHVAILTPGLTANNGNFGSYLAQDPVTNNLLVATPDLDVVVGSSFGSSSGAVWVFSFNGTDLIDQGGFIQPQGPDSNDLFGRSLTEGADMVVALSTERDASKVDHDVLYVYRNVSAVANLLPG
jgi:hypothetical protein